MSQQSPTYSTPLMDPSLRVGVVCAEFNSSITYGLRDGVVACLNSYGCQNICHASVPGAWELSLAARWLIESEECDGVIVLGAVVRGDTAHFDYVCQGTTAGVHQVMLETSKPISFGVLTTNTMEQAQLRSRKDDHNKGKEAALAMLAMLNLRTTLKQSTSGQV